MGSALVGSVDAHAWSLVTDFSSGQAPRFVHATADSPTSDATSIWHDVGGGLNNAVYAMAVSGNDLYVGGAFINPGGNHLADHLAKWDGSKWSNVGDSLNNGTGTSAPLNSAVYSLMFVGTSLYAGGHFTDAAGIPQADYIAKWDGSHWSALSDNVNSSNGSGGDGALNGIVYSIAARGNDIFAGGDFIAPAGLPTQRIAAWNGTNWSALSNNSSDLNNTVFALAVAGSDLFAGGRFSNVGGDPKAGGVVRWDGTSWHALGDNLNGVGSTPAVGSVYALALSGTDLYAGGEFQNAAGIQAADRIARWNGSTWSAVGAGTNGDGALTAGVRGLFFVGTTLFVGGFFEDAFDNPNADFIAQFDGSAWSALGDNLNGGGTNGALTDSVHPFAVIGSDLYVGGNFTDAAGITTADYLARWNLPITATRPDARIRKGTGAYVGNDIYNTTALNQSRSGRATRGHTIKFGISIQNDSTVNDRFTVGTGGAIVSGYAVKYFVGTTNITSAVIAGTYTTSTLAAGAKTLITAQVTIKAAAALGSSITRLITLSSIGDPSMKDAVKFVVSRK